jgi:hypothetical protein
LRGEIIQGSRSNGVERTYSSAPTHPPSATSHQASASASLFHYHRYVLVAHELFFVLTCFVSSYTPLAHPEWSTLPKKVASRVQVQIFLETSNAPKRPRGNSCEFLQVVLHLRFTTIDGLQIDSEMFP